MRTNNSPHGFAKAAVEALTFLLTVSLSAKREKIPLPGTPVQLAVLPGAETGLGLAWHLVLREV